MYAKRPSTASSRERRTVRPLDEQGLNNLALRYVERFATTRAKLRTYLDRKVRERGWDGPASPDTQAIAEQFAERGYVDDAGYALAKTRSLAGRGYGKRRLSVALRAAGVEESDSDAARAHAEEEAVAAAVRFAQRRRLGPFARREPASPAERDKAIGAMLRAGHDFALARTIVAMTPDEGADPEMLAKELAGAQ
jgi:regulatory protein